MTPSEHEEPEDGLPELERAKAEIPEPLPPSGFTASVMRRVDEVEEHLTGWRRWRRGARAKRVTNFLAARGVDTVENSNNVLRTGRAHFARREAIVTKPVKVLWAFVGVGAAVLLFGVVFGFPPSLSRGTEGTVGAAKRSQSAQIGLGDVKVGGSDLQQFLQSDAFDKLIKNSATRAAMAQIFSNPALAQVLANPALAQVLADPAFEQALANPAFEQALANPTFEQALANPAFAQALANPAFEQALANPAFAQALANPAFEQALANPAFEQALANPAFEQALANPAFEQALANPAFAQALANPAFEQALGSPAMLQAMNSALENIR
jgi:hypothetical protein